MADTNTAALCAEIIKSHFGPLSAVRTQQHFCYDIIPYIKQICATTLIRRGRLTFSQLIKFSQLKSRTARASILILIQHNLVWHAQPDDGVVGEALEFNVDECLLRMRFGRFVWQAEDLFGNAVGDVYHRVVCRFQSH